MAGRKLILEHSIFTLRRHCPDWAAQQLTILTMQLSCSTPIQMVVVNLIKPVTQFTFV